MSDLKKILIIEDEPILLKVLKDKVRKSNFNVVFAVDGEDGLNMIKKELPDLVLLDLMLPKIAGETVLKELKKNSKLNKIPVIVLSAKGDNATIKNCVDNLGAVDFMIKSDFTMDEVIDKINKYL